jgi:hypothetical protein
MIDPHHPVLVGMALLVVGAWLAFIIETKHR